MNQAEAKTCVKCATPYALTQQTLRVRGRELDLLFCLPCWRRFVLAKRLLVIAGAFDGLTVLGGAAVFIATGKLLPLVVGVILGMAALSLAIVFLQKARPV